VGSLGVPDQHLQLARDLGMFFQQVRQPRRPRHQLVLHPCQLRRRRDQLPRVTAQAAAWLRPYYRSLTATRAGTADVLRRGEGTRLTCIQWAAALLYNGLGHYREARDRQPSGYWAEGRRCASSLCTWTACGPPLILGRPGMIGKS
jgi:hypothetical protein